MDVDGLLAAVPDDDGLPLLTCELRSAIAEYAIAERRLAKLLDNRSIVGTIGASLQTLVGGNITLYTELCENARADDLDAPNSRAGYDLTLPDGARVQVKTRMGDASGGGEFGGFTARSVEEGLFDVAAFLRLDKDLLPTGALSVPRSLIPELARHRGGKLVCFWADLVRHPDGTQLLAAVSYAALGLRPNQEPDWNRLEGDL